MSDPALVRLLTSWYQDLVANDEANEPAPIAEVPEPKGDISGLSSIIDTEDLVETLSNQLSAGNYGVVCITGMQGSGKSSLSRSLAHRMHTDKGYTLIYCSGYDVLDAPEKLVAEAGNSKKIFVVIDDASYVFNSVSGRAASKLKQFFGIIRHALGGAQVCLAIITHVSSGIPPILRNSNVWIFSQPTLQEFDTLSKLTGKSEKARENLQKVFNSVTKIQAEATKNRYLTLTFGGKRYAFRWGVKGDPGSGRLMIAVLSGKAHIYHSVEEYCPECEHIGYDVKFNPANYINKKPVGENNAKEEDSAHK